MIEYHYSLREVTQEDHEWLVDLHNDDDVLNNITNPTKISLLSHLSWWSNIVKNDKEKRLIFYVDENRVGFTKFYSIDKNNSNCVLGADIERSHRGRGYAKHMWKLMLQKCFIEYDLHRVSLTTAEYNSIAIHLYTSLGFKVEGRSVESLFRDGRFYDQLCMYMLRNDWKK